MKNVFVIALHGIGGNLHHLSGLVNYYLSKEIDVKAIDLLGFGHTTPTSRGDIESFDEYILEVENYVKELKKNHSDYKIILLGENIGGLIAMQFSISHQKEIDGLILINPVTETKHPFPLLARFFLTICSFILPGKYFTIPIKPEDISDDEKMLHFLRDDIQKVKAITARFWWAMIRATVELKAEAGKIRIPVLMQLSKVSKTIGIHSAKSIFSRINTVHKHLQEFDIPDSMTICKDREKVFEKQIKFIHNIILSQ